MSKFMPEELRKKLRKGTLPTPPAIVRGGPPNFYRLSRYDLTLWIKQYVRVPIPDKCDKDKLVVLALEIWGNNK